MTETVITVNSGHQTSAPSTAGPLSWIVINLQYFKKIPGIIKIVQFILGLICMILASPPYFGITTFFLFVVVVAFIATILWCAAYFLGIREALTLPINWLLTEIINTGILTILYLIGSIMQLFSTHGKSSLVVAAVFGVLNSLAYAAGSYFIYLELRLS